MEERLTQPNNNDDESYYAQAASTTGETSKPILLPPPLPNSNFNGTRPKLTVVEKKLKLVKKDMISLNSIVQLYQNLNYEHHELLKKLEVNQTISSRLLKEYNRLRTQYTQILEMNDSLRINYNTLVDKMRRLVGEEDPHLIINNLKSKLASHKVMVEQLEFENLELKLQGENTTKLNNQIKTLKRINENKQFRIETLEKMVKSKQANIQTFQNQKKLNLQTQLHTFKTQNLKLQSQVDTLLRIVNLKKGGANDIKEEQQQQNKEQPEQPEAEEGGDDSLETTFSMEELNLLDPQFQLLAQKLLQTTQLNTCLPHFNWKDQWEKTQLKNVPLEMEWDKEKDKDNLPTIRLMDRLQIRMDLNEDVFVKQKGQVREDRDLEYFQLKQENLRLKKENFKNRTHIDRLTRRLDTLELRNL